MDLLEPTDHSTPLPVQGRGRLLVGAGRATGWPRTRSGAIPSRSPMRRRCAATSPSTGTRWTSGSRRTSRRSCTPRDPVPSGRRPRHARGHVRVSVERRDGRRVNARQGALRDRPAAALVLPGSRTSEPTCWRTATRRPAAPTRALPPTSPCAPAGSSRTTSSGSTPSRGARPSRSVASRVLQRAGRPGGRRRAPGAPETPWSRHRRAGAELSVADLTAYSKSARREILQSSECGCVAFDEKNQLGREVVCVGPCQRRRRLDDRRGHFYLY